MIIGIFERLWKVFFAGSSPFAACGDTSPLGSGLRPTASTAGGWMLSHDVVWLALNVTLQGHKTYPYLPGGLRVERPNQV
jgi:hypothetical protein